MDQFTRRRQEFFAPYAERLRQLQSLKPELDRGDRLSRMLEGTIDAYLDVVVDLGRLIGLELTLRSERKEGGGTGIVSGSAPSSPSQQRVSEIVATLRAHRETRGIQKQALGLVIGRTAHDITRFDSGRLRYNLSFVIEYASVLDLELVFADPTMESIDLPGTEGLNPDMLFEPAPELHVASKRKIRGKGRHGTSSGALAGLGEMIALRDRFLKPMRDALDDAAQSDRVAHEALRKNRLFKEARSGRDSPLVTLCTMLSATGHVPILVPSNAVEDHSYPTSSLRLDPEVDHERRGRELAWAIVRQLEEIRRAAGCDKQDLVRLAGHRLHVPDTPDGPLPRLSSIIRIADVFDLRLLSAPADSAAARSDPLPRRPRIRPSRLHAPYKLRHVAGDAERVNKLGAGREALAEHVAVKARRKAADAEARKAEATRLEAVREKRRGRRTSMSPAELAELERISRKRKDQRTVRKALAAQHGTQLDLPGRIAAVEPSLRAGRGTGRGAPAGNLASEMAAADAIRELRARLGEFGNEIRQRDPPFAALLAATTRTGQSIVLKAGRRTALLRTRRPASQFAAEWNAFLEGVLKPMDRQDDPTGALTAKVSRLSPEVTLNLVLRCLAGSGIRLMLI